ncbi:hypothetical protein KQJ29_39180, partial [Enterococcus sp. S181_ASV_20]|nr:hypothetical protein [Enterococcus sp. S181_ASV_20]
RQRQMCIRDSIPRIEKVRIAIRSFFSRNRAKIEGAPVSLAADSKRSPAINIRVETNHSAENW